MNRSHSSHKKPLFVPSKKYTAKKAYKFQLKMLMVFCIPEAMGTGKALTDLERGRIQGMHEVGLTGRAIAHAVNRSRDAVIRVVSGYVGRIRTGRPQNLSDRDLCNGVSLLHNIVINNK